MIIDILDALKDQLDDLLVAPPGITIHVEGRWFLIAETPAIDMRIGNAFGLEAPMTGFTKHMAYGAIPVVIRVRCGMAAAIEGQDLLYGLIDSDGPLSILAALDSDRTLGGVCDSIAFGDGGFPWTGIAPYIDANGDGSLAGSEMTIVVEMTQS